MSVFDTAVQSAEIARTEGQHLEGRLVTAQSQLAAAEAEIESLELETQGRDFLIAQLREDVVRLQAELIECQNRTTVFGAYAQPQGTAALDSFIRDIGPVGVQRTFYGSGSKFPTSERPGIATIASIVTRNYATGARPTYADVLAGKLDPSYAKFAAQVATYLGVYPSETLIMSFVAEPDLVANQDLGTPANHAAAYRHVRALFDAAGARVPWALILTGWTFDPASGRKPDPWWDASYEYLGIDPYNMWSPGEPDSRWHMLDLQVSAAATFAKVHAAGLIVPEFGCQEDPLRPSRRAEWLLQTAALFRANHVEHACYFNAAKPAEGKDWRLTGAAARAYGDVLRA